jgi:hypothetical protein
VPPSCLYPLMFSKGHRPGTFPAVRSAGAGSVPSLLTAGTRPRAVEVLMPVAAGGRYPDQTASGRSGIDRGVAESIEQELALSGGSIDVGPRGLESQCRSRKPLTLRGPAR